MSPAEILKWRDRAEAANRRGHFDAADDSDAVAWDRCAVGEQVKLFPKIVLLTSFADPLDKVLANLGAEFGNAVRDSFHMHMSETDSPYHWWTQKYKHPILRAFELLDLIEARVMVLKARAA